MFRLTSQALKTTCLATILAVATSPAMAGSLVTARSGGSSTTTIRNAVPTTNGSTLRLNTATGRTQITVGSNVNTLRIGNPSHLTISAILNQKAVTLTKNGPGSLTLNSGTVFVGTTVPPNTGGNSGTGTGTGTNTGSNTSTGTTTLVNTAGTLNLTVTGSTSTNFSLAGVGSVLGGPIGTVASLVDLYLQNTGTTETTTTGSVVIPAGTLVIAATGTTTTVIPGTVSLVTGSPLTLANQSVGGLIFRGSGLVKLGSTTVFNSGPIKVRGDLDPANPGTAFSEANPVSLLQTEAGADFPTGTRLALKPTGTPLASSTFTIENGTGVSLRLRADPTDPAVIEVLLPVP